MKIRPAKEEDYPQIASIREDTIRYINSKDYPEDIIVGWIAKNNVKKLKEEAHNYKRWVATEDNEIVGFCDHDFKCHLTRLYVKKDQLRKGIGSQLIKVAEASLKKEGCKTITIKSSITAKPFYEKQGYTAIKKSMDEEIEIYLMEKKTN